MSRITQIFDRLRAEQGKALMPFVTGGYPSLEVTTAVLPALAEAGATVVEVGIPFSDPIADGPVIAGSMYQALQHGVTPRDVFAAVRQSRDEHDLGLVAMVSVSIVARMGLDRFFDEAKQAGFDGVIIPDADTHDAAQLSAAADARDMSNSLLIAPRTARQRAAELAQHSRGFVYALARVGITGEHTEAPQIEQRVDELRALTDLPIAVGFGISTPAHVSAVWQHADAAIVGSALVRRMGEAGNPVEAVASFVAELAGGFRPRA